MALTVGCPRCATPVARAGDRWSCPDHGIVTPLWRPAEASYDEGPDDGGTFADDVDRFGAGEAAGSYDEVHDDAARGGDAPAGGARW